MGKPFENINNIIIKITKMEITIEGLIGMGIVGAMISCGMQFLKAEFGVESGITKMIVIIVSLVAGSIWYLFSTADWFITVVGILAAASTFWALFLKKGETQDIHTEEEL